MPGSFKTGVAAEATLKVLVTDIRGEADRFVCFADSQWDGDLKVYRTDVASDVEWLSTGKAGVL
jgi:hypothetical protein